MTENRLLCLTIEPEFGRLKNLFCENKIKHSFRVRPPASSDRTCFCIYEMYVEDSDLTLASLLLGAYGYPVWVGK